MKVAVALFSFLLGSIPFGVLVAKAFGAPDPRKVGSKNIGATNVTRAAGAKAGIITLILDISKGAIPVMVARHTVEDPTFLIWCGFFAVLGHCFSPFLKFNGGKGVATGAGAFLAINPGAFMAAVAVFAITFAARRIVSLSSMVSAALMPLFVYALDGKREAMITALISIFIITRHKENIKRLLRGEEKPLEIRKGQP